MVPIANSEQTARNLQDLSPSTDDQKKNKKCAHRGKSFPSTPPHSQIRTTPHDSHPTDATLSSRPPPRDAFSYLVSVGLRENQTLTASQKNQIIVAVKHAQHELVRRTRMTHGCRGHRAVVVEQHGSGTAKLQAHRGGQPLHVVRQLRRRHAGRAELRREARRRSSRRSVDRLDIPANNEKRYEKKMLLLH